MDPQKFIRVHRAALDIHLTPTYWLARIAVHWTLPDPKLENYPNRVRYEIDSQTDSKDINWSTHWCPVKVSIWLWHYFEYTLSLCEKSWFILLFLLSINIEVLLCLQIFPRGCDAFVLFILEFQFSSNYFFLSTFLLTSDMSDFSCILQKWVAGRAIIYFGQAN